MLIQGAFRFFDKSPFAGAPVKSGYKGLEKWGGFELADGGTLFLDEIGAWSCARPWLFTHVGSQSFNNLTEKPQHLKLVRFNIKS
jgi:hypothetical protein